MDALVVSPLLQVVFDKLALVITRKSTTRGDYEKEMQKLQDRLPIIQAVIEDAEERQHGDKKIKIWLQKLKDVAYDAEDLLDMIHARVLSKQVLESDRFTYSPSYDTGILGKGKLLAEEFGELMNRKVRLASHVVESLPNYFVNLRKMRDIRERLDDIAKEIGEFQLKEVLMSRLPQTGNREERETGPHIVGSDVCGRKEDVEKVVKMLLGSNTDVRVISIIGIGGIGKTTVAQLAYNDERVKKHFDLKIWISLYGDFNPRKIMSEMLDYAAKGKYDPMSQMGLLQSELRKALYGKRYLLVLDDVWNEDPDEWDKVKNLLGDGTNGNKVIVTSRSGKVASIMSSSPAYHLEALSEDDCWTLFKQRAFPDGDENGFPSLLPIGKQIIDKCKGVPLAAKVLGSLMRFKREESEWLRVQGSELWNLDGGENKILQVLKLSFDHLPSHLKRCFAYCAVFPKKFEICKEKLIHQWIAGGLAQRSAHDRVSEPEDIGSDYLNDLLRMSFLEVVSGCDDSSTTRIKMHDLIHDLAISVAGNEFLTAGKTEQQGTLAESHSLPKVCDFFTTTRHAVVDSNSSSSPIHKALYRAKGLRTLNLLSLGDASEKAIGNLISSFKYLRILNLSGFGIKKLHKSVGDLTYLRYLDLSNTPIEKLPESICNLQLQTLDLSSCDNLQKLPTRTPIMTSLRHLKIKKCARLARLPELQNLRGELKIKHLENVERWHIPPTDLITEDLPGTRHKSFLENMQLNSLGLSWEDADEHKLSGTEFPYWMNAAALCNLIQLELANCTNCESLPTLGELPLLKVLRIQGMDSVVNIGNEFFGGMRAFPSLTEFSLKDFPKLETWSTNLVEAFTCLNKLTIINCPVLTTMPWFPSLQHVEIRNCHPVMLRSVAQLRSISTLIIGNFPELLYIPKALIENNLPLLSLTISSCPKLRSLPANVGQLQNLKFLKIGWFQELHSLPHGLTNLTSLESLEIIDCPKIVSLPEESLEGLSSLRSLSIENSQSLASQPSRMQFTTALERLTIMYCSYLVSLPNGLQHLSALKSLSILSCTGLASLPEGLQFITTLQNLEIHDCPQVMELPAWVENLVSLRSLTISDCQNIKSLPEGLQRLRALQHLSISGCPELEKRCQRGNGVVWQKISHTPYIYLGSSTLQQRRDTASSSSTS
ncbi:disease resistance protein RGA3 [Populus alba x Populus x berolinensis]|nr:disease resistance protein RGA3 [Populus alba x Populus x berolinensis]